MIDYIYKVIKSCDIMYVCPDFFSVFFVVFSFSRKQRFFKRTRVLRIIACKIGD